MFGYSSSKKVQYGYHDKNGVLSDHTERTYLLTGKYIRFMLDLMHFILSFDRKSFLSILYRKKVLPFTIMLYAMFLFTDREKTISNGKYFCQPCNR